MRMDLSGFLVVLVLLNYAAKCAKPVRKRPTPVTDPPRMRSLEDWVSLGREALLLSCNAVNLDPVRTIHQLAQRLLDFYAVLPPPSDDVQALPPTSPPDAES